MEQKLYEAYKADMDNIKITREERSLLLKIAHWANFLSILGFIFLGLSALLILLSGVLITMTNNYMEINNGFPYSPGVFSWSHALIYLIIIAVSFFPMYFLYKFSTHVKRSFARNDGNLFTKSLNYLKDHYTYIGTVTIVILVLLMINLGIMLLRLFAF